MIKLSVRGLTATRVFLRDVCIRETKNERKVRECERERKGKKKKKKLKKNKDKRKKVTNNNDAIWPTQS